MYENTVYTISAILRWTNGFNNVPELQNKIRLFLSVCFDFELTNVAENLWKQ